MLVGAAGSGGTPAQAGNSRGRPWVSSHVESLTDAQVLRMTTTGQNVKTTFNELVSAAGPRARLVAFTVTSPGTHSSDSGSRLSLWAELPAYPVGPPRPAGPSMRGRVQRWAQSRSSCPGFE